LIINKALLERPMFTAHKITLALLGVFGSHFPVQ